MRPLLLALLVLSACGPVRYTGVLWEADKELEAARAAGAAERATYELTLAEEYLHKARDVAGHALYDDAGVYGRQAIEFAKAAHKKADGHVPAEVK